MVLVGAGSQELAAAGLVMTWRTRCSSPRSSSPSASSTTPPAPATCGSCPASAAGCPRSRSSAVSPRSSMAGVPPLLGFVGKEAAFAALLEGGLADRTAASSSSSGSWRLGTDRRLHAALLVGRVRPQARPADRRRRSRAPAGALFLAAPAVLAAERARARPGEPAARAAGGRLRRHAAAGRRRAPRSWRSGTAGSPRSCCRRSACSAARPCSPAARRSPAGSAGSPSAPPPTRATGTPSRASTGWPSWSPAPPSGARCRPTSARSSSWCWRCPAPC